MLKSEKRFKYIKGVEDIYNLLSITFSNLKKENLVNNTFALDDDQGQDFEVMQKIGCYIKGLRQSPMFLVNDYEILDESGQPFKYATDYLQKDLAEREGLSYIKDLRKYLIAKSTAKIDAELTPFYKGFNIENPEDLTKVQKFKYLKNVKTAKTLLAPVFKDNMMQTELIDLNLHFGVTYTATVSYPLIDTKTYELIANQREFDINDDYEIMNVGIGGDGNVNGMFTRRLQAHLAKVFEEEYISDLEDFYTNKLENATWNARRQMDENAQ